MIGGGGSGAETCGGHRLDALPLDHQPLVRLIGLIVLCGLIAIPFRIALWAIVEELLVSVRLLCHGPQTR
jgi:hypothetical protein